MAHCAPRRATYRVNPDGSVTMRFTYHPAPIQAFKDQIPAAFRRYAPSDGKSWTVDAEYSDEAITILLRYFPNAEAEFTRQSRTHAKTQTQQTGSDPYAVLHLLPSAPPELIGAAFRVLAKKVHPDAGGTDAGMRELIAAHETLSRRIGA